MLAQRAFLALIHKAISRSPEARITKAELEVAEGQEPSIIVDTFDYDRDPQQFVITCEELEVPQPAKLPTKPSAAQLAAANAPPTPPDPEEEAADRAAQEAEASEDAETAEAEAEAAGDDGDD